MRIVKEYGEILFQIDEPGTGEGSRVSISFDATRVRPLPAATA
ncbi:MAG: hypothetical protein QM739_08185 [Propionivibrio sp.]